jgi:hypothetical protein
MFISARSTALGVIEHRDDAAAVDDGAHDIVSVVRLQQGAMVGLNLVNILG